MTALMYTVVHGQYEIFKLLLSYNKGHLVNLHEKNYVRF